MASRLLKNLAGAIANIGEYSADYGIRERDRKDRLAEDAAAEERWNRQFNATRGDVAQERADRISDRQRADDRLSLQNSLDEEADARDPVKKLQREKANLTLAISGGADPSTLTEGQRQLIGYAPEQTSLKDVVDQLILNDPDLLRTYLGNKVGGRASTKGDPSYSDMRQEANDFKESTIKRLRNRIMMGLAGANRDYFDELMQDKKLDPESVGSLRVAIADPKFHGTVRRGGFLGLGGEEVPRMSDRDSTVLEAIADSLVTASGTPSMRLAQRYGYFDQGEPATEDGYYDPNEDLYGSENEADYVPAEAPRPATRLQMEPVAMHRLAQPEDGATRIRSEEELLDIPESEWTDDEIDFYGGGQ